MLSKPGPPIQQTSLAGNAPIAMMQHPVLRIMRPSFSVRQKKIVILDTEKTNWIKEYYNKSASKTE